MTAESESVRTLARIRLCKNLAALAACAASVEFANVQTGFRRPHRIKGNQNSQ